MDAVLGISMALGIISTLVGSYWCVVGHNYSVAAQHEDTAVGQIVGKSKGDFLYEFSLNGIKVDDYSEVCETPLAPDACSTKGPVLVYYSYQPYQNSRLEDFAIASTHAYLIGKPTLAIGLILIVLPGTVIVVLFRKNRRDGDSESTEGRSQHNDEPDAIHIVPGE